MQDEQPPVEITVYENGPVVVRGAYKLQNRDRKEIDPGRETIALCRCGLSALKPFCDGNHALRGAARSELRADPEGRFPFRQVRAPKLSTISTWRPAPRVAETVRSNPDLPDMGSVDLYGSFPLCGNFSVLRQHFKITCVCGMSGMSSLLEGASQPVELRVLAHSGHMDRLSCGRKGSSGRKGTGNRRPIFHETPFFPRCAPQPPPHNGHTRQNRRPSMTRRKLDLFEMLPTVRKSFHEAEIYHANRGLTDGAAGRAGLIHQHWPGRGYLGQGSRRSRERRV
ncbi:MAG: CDGSH iron-sulfur domain-containing protein [Streptosporangiaceae bacterium]|nr:CDGSH iron-sulfur domain-containing protein [Streptosporangiaceae bacterium]